VVQKASVNLNCQAKSSYLLARGHRGAGTVT